MQDDKVFGDQNSQEHNKAERFVGDNRVLRVVAEGIE